ncbi:MAG: hypothetical protein AAF840_18160 [Bacteroidota bacterium]
MEATAVMEDTLTREAMPVTVLKEVTGYTVEMAVMVAMCFSKEMQEMVVLEALGLSKGEKVVMAVMLISVGRLVMVRLEVMAVIRISAERLEMAEMVVMAVMLGMEERQVMEDLVEMAEMLIMEVNLEEEEMVESGGCSFLMGRSLLEWGIMIG